VRELRGKQEISDGQRRYRIGGPLPDTHLLGAAPPWQPMGSESSENSRIDFPHWVGRRHLVALPRTHARLRSAPGPDHRDLHPVAERGKDAYQQIC
jgi:hypothetical protein